MTQVLVRKQSITRLSADQINKLAGKAGASQVTVAGAGDVLPVVYGRVKVSGKWCCHGTISTDLVVGVAWALGECEQVEAVYIDDAAPAVGLTVTSYTGTTAQGIDANLAAAMAGYTDTWKKTLPGGQVGVCYSSISIPTATGRKVPRSFAAIIKGRKLYDPRTGLWAYSDNPALALLDVLTNPLWGTPYTVLGAAELADWCDALVDGSPRCRVGLAISDVRSRLEYAALLAEYAECLWPIWEGDAIRLRPDAAVASVSRTFTSADISGGVKISVEAAGRTPTEVECRYTDASGTTSPWQQVPEVVQLLGVESGTIPRRNTAVSLPGIQRAAEARRKAAQRLRRGQVPDRYRWQTHDASVAEQLGDVVALTVPSAGLAEQWLRITDVNMTGPGWYDVSGEGYSDAVYTGAVAPPSGNTVDVPVGAIVPMVSGTLPSGWAAWTAANGKAVRGATTAGTTGGSNTISLSGTITAAGGHNGTGFSVIKGGTNNASLDNYWAADVGYAQPDHTHTVSGTATANPSRAAYPWIIKTGTPGTLVPINAGVLSHCELGHINIQRVLDSVGRMLAAATAKALSGSDSLTLSPTYSAVADHAHGSGILDNETRETGSTHVVYEHLNAGGHSHAGSGALSVKLRHKRRRMVLHTGVADYPLLPGAYIGWDGSAGANPGAGWVLADGNNGTVNLMGHLIELADPSVGGSVNGDDTYLATGSTTTDGAHSHLGAGTSSTKAIVSITHRTTAGAHAHTVSKTGAYTPPWYGLQFFMWGGA